MDALDTVYYEMSTNQVTWYAGTFHRECHTRISDALSLSVFSTRWYMANDLTFRTQAKKMSVQRVKIMRRRQKCDDEKTSRVDSTQQNIKQRVSALLPWKPSIYNCGDVWMVVPAFHDDSAYGVEYDNSGRALVGGREDEVFPGMPECKVLSQKSNFKNQVRVSTGRNESITYISVT